MAGTIGEWLSRRGQTVRAWSGLARERADGVGRRALVSARRRRIEERAPSVRRVDEDAATMVESYWVEHTVRSSSFATARSSARYLEWRFDQYPLFREFAGLWGDHDGEVVLDYGCGPGNDVTGFLIHTGARKVIGMDVSATALGLTRWRLALHEVDHARVDLVEVSDSSPDTGLADGEVDYLNCQGVLQHTSDPARTLRELRRVLRPGASGRIMVYNRQSVWLHLHTAYVRMLLEGRYAGMGVEEAFGKTTDGEDCPIARCYRGEGFVALCESAGLQAEFLGGYLSRAELGWLEEHGAAAIADERLADEHREFLRELETDQRGLPRWRGMHAGVGGTYAIRAAA